jgi:Tfp pilus tip-associated adhesin PilY1
LDPENLPIEPIVNEKGERLVCRVEIGMNEVAFQAWRVNVGRVSVYLLDANLAENEQHFRDLTLRVYGGDRLGNVWRIDLTSLTATSGTADVARLATLRDPSGNPQPVTSTPQMMNVGAARTRMVYVGTGRYLGESDLSDTQVQTIYGLGEDLTLLSTSAAYISNGHTVLPSAGLTLRQQLNHVVLRTLSVAAGDGVDDATTRKAVPPVCSAEAAAAGIGCVGWYADLPSAGERVNLDGGKSVVMQAQNLLAANKIRRPDGVLNAHSEVVPDAQRGKRQPGGFANQLHVHR